MLSSVNDIDENIHGYITLEDEIDTFDFYLVNGFSYTFDILGLSTLSGSLPDPYIRGLLDVNNNVLLGTVDDDGGLGLNSRISFTPLVSNSYKLKV